MERVSGLAVAALSPRVDPPRVTDRVTTPYRFGLNGLATGTKVAHLDALRDMKEITLAVEPRIVLGGVRVAYRGSGGSVERFFRCDAPEGPR